MDSPAGSELSLSAEALLAGERLFVRGLRWPGDGAVRRAGSPTSWELSPALQALIARERLRAGSAGSAGGAARRGRSDP